MYVCRHDGFSGLTIDAEYSIICPNIPIGMFGFLAAAYRRHYHGVSIQKSISHKEQEYGYGVFDFTVSFPVL